MNESDAPGVRPARAGRVAIAVLLLAPFVGTLWVSGYARLEPTLWGFPFFYWYQLLWVPIAAACTGAAYWLTRRLQQGPTGRPRDTDEKEQR